MQRHIQKLFLFFALTLILPAYAAANPVQKDTDTIIYTVKSGDTLINLGSRYLNNPNAYRIVQRDNNIANPRALPVGKALKIQRSLLKFQSANAKILSVRGNVLLGSNRAAAGQNVGEGAVLKTSGASFVTLGLPNGSRISLPSNSDMQIRLLRTYALGGNLDYDFAVAKGGARSNVVPLKSADDRFRIRTPRAVSAVRGTEFETRYDDNAGLDFAEVVEGALVVDAGANAATDLPAGNGLLISQNGGAIKEVLLSEPKLIEPGKIQADPDLVFNIDPKQNERGYRLNWATDAGFVDQVADLTISGTQARLPDIANGNYFVRARAISANGIQGNPVTYAFKRRLNGVSASAGAGDDGYNFKWQSQGEGTRKFHFQLFRGVPNGLPIADEPGLTDQQITISDLPNGDYFWRVGSVQYDQGEVATNWTSFEKLSVAP
jgi:hypothetical protein